MNNKEAVSAHTFVATLAANVKQEALTDAEFRALVLHSLPVVEFAGKEQTEWAEPRESVEQVKAILQAECKKDEPFLLKTIEDNLKHAARYEDKLAVLRHTRPHIAQISAEGRWAKIDDLVELHCVIKDNFWKLASSETRRFPDGWFLICSYNDKSYYAIGEWKNNELVHGWARGQGVHLIYAEVWLTEGCPFLSPLPPAPAAPTHLKIRECP